MNQDFTATFAPDGMSGGAEGFNTHQRHYMTDDQDAHSAHQSTDSDHGHDYDDGLVHSHNWAVSSPER
jgi:hypothetical protein